MDVNQLYFRSIKKTDLNDVYFLLNQLKSFDISSILLNKDAIWEKIISNKDNFYIVGIDKISNKIIAYGSLVIENKINGLKAGHIEDIIVDDNVRGKRVGDLLIKYLISLSRQHNCYRITLFCKKELYNFYSKNGFDEKNISMSLYL